MRIGIPRRPSTLKGQILLLCATICVAMIVMQGGFALAYIRTSMRNGEALLKSRVELLAESLESLAVRLQDVGYLLTFNGTTQRIFRPDVLSAKLQLVRATEITIDSIKSSNTSIEAIVITDFRQLYIGDVNNDDFWLLNKARDVLAADGKTIAGTRYLHFAEASSGSAYFVCAVPSKPEGANQAQFFTLIIHDFNSLRKMARDFGDAAGNYELDFGAGAALLLRGGPSAFTERPNSRPTDRAGGFSKGRDYLFYSRSVDFYGLELLGSMPESDILRSLGAFELPNAIMIAVMLAFIIAEGWLLIHNITEPISYMVEFIDSLSADDAGDKRLRLRFRNEIGLLSNDINNLLDRIRQMTDSAALTSKQLYETKLAKQQAELAAFQSQVNPHFLYNTLDCIRGMALSRELPEIGEIAADMVKIFRYSVKEGDIVLLGDELACIEHYLAIMQVRHPGRFSIAIDVDAGVRRALVPKMVLQPVVENAMIHGLEPKRGEGNLRIRGRLEGGDELALEVEDDGKGLSEEGLEALRRSIVAPVGEEEWPGGPRTATKSVGLVNIERRIRLLYGMGYGLAFAIGAAGGLLVSIRLPYRPDGSEPCTE